MVKKGDTLVEVALAIGIFSMVAIAITSVISSSTAGTQTALETTLTREEIDTQAESLRFIQNAYAANQNESSGNKVDALWQAIKEQAIDFDQVTFSTLDADQLNATLQYNPTTCQNMLTDLPVEVAKRAFVINPRALSTLSDVNIDVDDSVNSILITNSGTNASKFTSPSIYPRLVFGGDPENNGSLVTDGTGTFNQLYRAEGIYVIAVRDNDTRMATEDGVEKTGAYYDFYIRSCWYGINADEPSTVSTVIRLYDPDSVAAVSGRDQRIMVSYYETISDLALNRNMKKNYVSTTAGNYKLLSCAEVLINEDGSVNPDCNNGNFRGWRSARDGAIYNPGYEISGSGSGSRYYRFSAAWKHKHFFIYYNNNSINLGRFVIF